MAGFECSTFIWKDEGRKHYAVREAMPTYKTSHSSMTAMAGPCSTLMCTRRLASVVCPALESWCSHASLV
jgi:hypothetical protein